MVQRKKLRAKKIGRNFYTTQKWFEEYLRKHGKDEIREAYTALLRPVVEKFQPKVDPLLAEKIENNNSKIIQIHFNWKAVALAAVFFVASIIWVLVGPSLNKGRIAGEEESVNYDRAVIEPVRYK